VLKFTCTIALVLLSRVLNKHALLDSSGGGGLSDSTPKSKSEGKIGVIKEHKKQNMGGDI
jgi:hypothetical protein